MSELVSLIRPLKGVTFYIKHYSVRPESSGHVRALGSSDQYVPRRAEVPFIAAKDVLMDWPLLSKVKSGLFQTSPLINGPY